MVAILSKQATAARTQAMTSAPLLSLRDVSRRFVSSRQDTTAVDNITLDVAAGEFVCVVGPSGCGKSTLLNIVAGVDHADSGEVLFDGRAIRRAAADRV